MNLETVMRSFLESSGLWIVYLYSKCVFFFLQITRKFGVYPGLLILALQLNFGIFPQKPQNYKKIKTKGTLI